MTETRIEKLRQLELDSVKSWFAPSQRVLEIGGGNGYQAKLISSWGCDIVSIDIPERPHWPVTYFDVQNYDGVNIPFPDNSFDLVFSSNVLEHVPRQNLPKLLQEMRRVMRQPNALALQILPSAAWRFWNNFAHYLYLVKYVSGYGKSAMMPTIPSRDEALKKYSLPYLMKQALIPSPHGEYPNALSELYFFSQRRWVKEFSQAGFNTQQVISTEVFYTGYGLAQDVSVENRRWLSQFLGTSTYAYLLN